MTTNNLFDEQPCDSLRFLVGDRESFRPLREVVHEHGNIAVTLGSEWELQDVNCHSMEWSTYWNRTKKGAEGLTVSFSGSTDKTGSTEGVDLISTRQNVSVCRTLSFQTGVQQSNLDGLPLTGLSEASRASRCTNDQGAFHDINSHLKLLAFQHDFPRGLLFFW